MQTTTEPVNGTAEAHAEPSVVVTATFTAEPIELALRFWLKELGADDGVRFAPYNQVFQQLLDPHSLLGRNRGGVNLVLVRFEDWLPVQPGGRREERFAPTPRNWRRRSSPFRGAARRRRSCGSDPRRRRWPATRPCRRWRPTCGRGWRRPWRGSTPSTGSAPKR